MDLKSKRILGISQIIICIAMLLLYTRIGSIGMVYVAITLEIVFGLILLFLGNTTTNKFYCIVSTAIIEVMLFLIHYFIIIPSDIMFVGTFLKLFMFLVPLYAILQWAKGILQAVLEPQVSAITDLLFCVTTVIGTLLTYLVLGKYGIKVAELMQSVKLEHFYVILSLIPGFVLGHVTSLSFLFFIAHMHKKEVLACMRELSFNKKNIFLSCIDTLKSQISNNYIAILQRIPIWVLLLLSMKEIKTDNYLFGHLYGAVLPLCGLVWHVFSVPLICFKKRLYVHFRKRMYEHYYNEIKIVLAYVFIYSLYFMTCIFSLHKSYLAVWSLQTSSSFMGLMKASSIVACLGFPYKVFIDIMYERNLKKECNVSIIFGVLLSIITAAICNNFLGVGNVLYILSLSVGIFVSVLMTSWFVGNEVGISYISVLKRTYKAIILNVFICLILIILENLIFTALGGFGTLIVCVLLSYALLRFGLLALCIFSKEERKVLSFSNNIKTIIGISRNPV